MVPKSLQAWAQTHDAQPQAQALTQVQVQSADEGTGAGTDAQKAHPPAQGTQARPGRRRTQRSHRRRRSWRREETQAQARAQTHLWRSRRPRGTGKAWAQTHEAQPQAQALINTGAERRRTNKKSPAQS